MTRVQIGTLLLFATYLASGLYIVRGNEQALVRRFGRAIPPLRDSGLHYDLPWPLSRVDRVNAQEVRTLVIGVQSGEPLEANGFLRDLFIERQGEFLTGDKNVLHLAVNVQYRVADPLGYLTQAESPEISLRLLVESLAADFVSRSGVDFVHPLGLSELRERMTLEARRAAQRQPWGLAVEDVTIAGAYPPVEVKAAFLDVSNARAEKDRGINEEQSRGEKRLAAARAEAAAKGQGAEAQRHARIAAAKGSADRFLAVIAQFQQAAATGDNPAAARQRTMQRLYTAAMEEILPRLRGKVLLDGSRPFDLTIFPSGETPAPAPAER